MRGGGVVRNPFPNSCFPKAEARREAETRHPKALRPIQILAPKHQPPKPRRQVCLRLSVLGSRGCWPKWSDTEGPSLGAFPSKAHGGQGVWVVKFFSVAFPPPAPWRGLGSAAPTGTEAAPAPGAAGLPAKPWGGKSPNHRVGAERGLI